MVYKSKDWGLHSSIQLPIMAQVSPLEDEFDGEFDIDIEKTTKSPSTSLSDSSAIMMSKHSMNMGCYEINLGTVRGQRIHALHLILLPLLPILILIVQNYSTFDFNKVRKKYQLLYHLLGRMFYNVVCMCVLLQAALHLF